MVIHELHVLISTGNWNECIVYDSLSFFSTTYKVAGKKAWKGVQAWIFKAFLTAAQAALKKLRGS